MLPVCDHDIPEIVHFLSRDGCLIPLQDIAAFYALPLLNDRPKGKAAAISGPGSAGTHDSVTAHSKADAAGGGQPCSGDASSIEGVAGASPAAEDAVDGASQPARSRRSESAPLVRRPNDLAAAGARQKSPFSGDGLRSRRSLDLKPLSDNSATRPGEFQRAERLLKDCSVRRHTVPSWSSRPMVCQAGKWHPAARRKLLSAL